MHGAPRHLSKCMHTLRRKCTCTRACAPMQRCRNFFVMETIANLSWVLREHHAGCRLPPALLLSRRNQSPGAVCSKNPSKCTLAHDAVAAAVSHKLYSIIRVGAGLIKFVYSSHLKRGHGAHFIKNSNFAIFLHEFQYIYVYIYIYIYIYNTHICMHKYIHTYKHTDAHTCKHALIHICSIHKYVYIHLYIYIYMYICI